MFFPEGSWFKQGSWVYIRVIEQGAEQALLPPGFRIFRGCCHGQPGMRGDPRTHTNRERIFCSHQLPVPGQRDDAS